MKKLVLSLILLIACNVSYAGEKAKKTSNKSWQPTPFVLNATRFSVNYKGTDPNKFLKLLNSNISKLEKDEFESEEEYAKRMVEKEKLIYPINFSDQYAFPLDEIEFKYSVEKRAYEFSRGFCVRHDDTTIDVQMACRISLISWDEDRYIGSNAYGAEVEIFRVRKKIFAFALPKASSYIKTMTAENYYGNLEYKDTLPVDIEKARKLKKLNIRAVIVGRLVDAKVLNFSLEYSRPKLNDPFDTDNQALAVPFEPNKIFYYVAETGEILGEQSF